MIIKKKNTGSCLQYLHVAVSLINLSGLWRLVHSMLRKNHSYFWGSEVFASRKYKMSFSVYWLTAGAMMLHFYWWWMRMSPFLHACVLVHPLSIGQGNLLQSKYQMVKCVGLKREDRRQTYEKNKQRRIIIICGCSSPAPLVQINTCEKIVWNNCASYCSDYPHSLSLCSAWSNLVGAAGPLNHALILLLTYIQQL